MNVTLTNVEGIFERQQCQTNQVPSKVFLCRGIDCARIESVELFGGGEGLCPNCDK
jgi:hypothetical protein